MLPGWHEQPISKSHKQDEFECGEIELDLFLRQHARQSHEKGAAKTFVAVPNSDPTTVLGYYSVCPASIEFFRTPESIRKGLARHEVPVFRLARLAVSRIFQGKGLGTQLLLAAGRRCLFAAEQVGGVALLIDAKHDRAAMWYESLGALRLIEDRRSLLLPLKTIRSALDATGQF